MVSTNGSGVDQSATPDDVTTEDNQDQGLSVREQRQIRRENTRTEAVRQRRNQDRLLTEFQPDAVEIETRSVPFGAPLTLYTVVALMLATVAWACWAEVDKIVTAQGKLITVDPPVVIDTSVASQIRAMNVEFGDRVVAGQVLATLDPTYPEADLKQLRGRIESLDALIARLNAERDGLEFNPPQAQTDPNFAMERSVFVRRKAEYVAKIREFEANIRKFNVQLANNETQIDLDRQAVARYDSIKQKTERLVEKGARSQQDLDGIALQMGTAQKTLRAAIGRREEFAKEIDAIKAQSEAYEATWQAEMIVQLAESTQQRKDAEQELAKVQHTNSQVELKVPSDLPQKEFFVLEVADVSVGSVSRPGEPVFRLVPLEGLYEAEVEVPGKDISLIREGTREQFANSTLPKGSQVRIKLASFPYQKHGTIDGVVRKISEGSFEKDKNAALINPEAATMYRTRVELIDPGTLNNVGKSFRLMPGMTVTAEIKVGKQRVVQYFLYPLLRYMDEAAREP
ncbi:HlyD family type I secretion periplasmic adaptor subunit [Mariniblastus fucicola]|uniref:Hemolysin secretion protein D, plasmid n=1 Tax=Mariniblastus fucicola TaxID=980251 RepID=A0A5B9PFP9_9BACT|nr:HlyD family type I secretion periplasmic adaptor subunit [Mariniblastus fucicola]QEG23456.1 Hemolysin secretion protein D, plasmid [Mariniblastus fucicola]